MNEYSNTKDANDHQPLETLKGRLRYRLTLMIGKPGILWENQVTMATFLPRYGDDDADSTGW